MKKSLITSAIAAAALFISTAAFAANPTVVLDSKTINFEDQQAVISEEGRTLVPARGVFEQMGARVDWFESDRSIAVVSEDSLTKVVLKIGDSTMKVRHFTGLMEYTEEQFTLDTPPQILNDRTMIPLRAVSEAFDCKVEWDAEAYKVIITTKKGEAEAAIDPATDTRIKMSIAADKEDVNAGDEVKVNVNVSNVKDELILSGLSSRIFFDQTKFEYVGCEMNMKDTSKEVLGGCSIYNNDSAKAVYIIMNSAEKLTDGAVCTYTFKALTDEGGEFVLSSEVSTERGSDTILVVSDANKTDASYKSEDEFVIDSATVVVK